MSIRKKVLMSGDSWAFGSGRVFFDGNHHIFGLPATDTGIHMRDLFTEYEFTNYPFLGGRNIPVVYRRQVRAAGDVPRVPRRGTVGPPEDRHNCPGAIGR